MVYLCFPETLQTAWIGIIFSYLALLQIIGIVLAVQTRKVKIKVLNDSKYIAALIYISSIALVLITAISQAPLTLIDLEEGMFSGCLLLATTMFLVLVFIPKVCLLASIKTWLKLSDFVDGKYLITVHACAKVTITSKD